MSSREKLKRKLYVISNNNNFQDDNYIADKLDNIENVIKNIDSYFFSKEKIHRLIDLKIFRFQ